VGNIWKQVEGKGQNDGENCIMELLDLCSVPRVTERMIK